MRLGKDPDDASLPSVSDTLTVLGLHAGVGATVRLDARFFSGFEVRYVLVKPRSFDEGNVATAASA